MSASGSGRTVTLEIAFKNGTICKCVHKSAKTGLRDILKEVITPDANGDRVKHFTRKGSENGCFFVNMVDIQFIEIY